MRTAGRVTDWRRATFLESDREGDVPYRIRFYGASLKFDPTTCSKGHESVVRHTDKFTNAIQNVKMKTDEQLFSKVVKENKSTIYSVCYMFSNDSDEVADLFQEVLIRLWRGFGSFHGQSDIKTWIYRVALNTCITIDKKKKRRSKARLSMDVDYFDESESSTAQVRMLHDRIARLQPLDRAIVLLWLEQVNYEEIGAIVGISAKNVSVRLTRIRLQLKKMSNTND